MKTFLTLVGALLLLGVPSLAQIIPMDYRNPGDGLLTRDFGTRLEWLDVPLTFDRSYEEIDAALAPGGEFEGFRFATETEFNALHTLVGIPAAHEDAPESREFGLISLSYELQSLLGFAMPPLDPKNYSARITSGYLDSSQHNDGSGSRLYGIIQIIDWQNPTLPDYYRAESYPVEPFTSPSSGAFLVRDFAPVPEPSTYALGGILLLGIAVGVRRIRRGGRVA